ncbi:hypothetical protein CH276_13565 [Rhodococcus sp. 06-470-2]|uniref:DUF3558 domain-containing protein n=1 Tax=unclassified Rhodococcus (in: high G+C Gram-positive bacteria) TaxID=192944 RepID=UPI000B9C569F|nr:MULTISPECIES: DUF3558 domain-containing protein [unclassified Rhodococcus (in: high G+C Gram-positive bacteria)]OZC63353.1 hypothetical protein CH276_13565 [Rhodococcus sp. 06-470-2]OZE61266.1 hypothetical protein CH265_18170 [Rhodococcus sp. 05-2221-1B]
MRLVGGRLLAVVCASALVLTGCGGSTQGSPVASGDASTESTTMAAGPEPFDPCTIPKSAVTASGLDVSTERPDFAGITTYPGWKGCTWDGAGPSSWYYVAVLSSLESIDDLLLSPSFVRGVDLKVSGRTAIQLRHADDMQFLGCAVALDAGDGLIVLDLQKKGSRDLDGEPCTEVNRHAVDLEPFFPA